jgi:hypothetical protein
LRYFFERWTSLASGIIPTLNHESRSKKEDTSVPSHKFAIVDSH